MAADPKSIRWFDNDNPNLRYFWHPVALVADVGGPEHIERKGPHPIRLLGEDFVIAHLNGEWRVLPTTCPHRLAPLSAGSVVTDPVAGDVVQCRYHGWCFDSEGTCVHIPALGTDGKIPPGANLEAPTMITRERYGVVWVAFDEPLCDIPEIPEWDDDRFGLAVIPPQTWNASAAQMADNFLDVAHFPFTHLGTIGDPDDLEVGDYQVEKFQWGFTSVHHHSSKVLGDATSGETESFTTFDRTMTFRCDAPHHVRLHIDYGDDGILVLTFFHQPVDLDHTTLYCFAHAENIADGRMLPEDHIAFQAEVGREDRELLEQIVQKGVALDAGAEIHTRADRSTLQLRRLLNEVDQYTPSDSSRDH